MGGVSDWEVTELNASLRSKAQYWLTSLNMTLDWASSRILTWPPDAAVLFLRLLSKRGGLSFPSSHDAPLKMIYRECINKDDVW